jgi:hypothetical protein
VVACSTGKATVDSLLGRSKIPLVGLTVEVGEDFSSANELHNDPEPCRA